MRLLFLFIFCFVVTVSFSQHNNYYLLVGTYTNGKSEGIYVYDFDATTGKTELVSKIKANNPSYLAISEDEAFVYAIEDNRNNTSSEAAAYHFDKKTGTLSFINKQQNRGIGACYITVDKTRKWLFMANYASGSLSVLPIKKDGSIDSVRQFFQHTGSSINPQRQKEPHVHTAILSPDEKYLFTTDLGTDRINRYAFDAFSNNPLMPTQDSVTNSTLGDGPRHIAFSPAGKFLYTINELSGTIDAFSLDKEHLQKLQSAIIDTADNGNTSRASADIHLSPDGKFLYATNRGAYNTISTYSVSKTNGKLTFLSMQPTGGLMPRNFTIDPTGSYLLIGHQKTDNITIFKRDKKTGLLTQTDKKIEVGSPVCLKLIPKD